ncbi:MAG: gliding motility lipoprotein GldD [Salinivirgaceae bacterium]|nr:gliding motility lipoprotein GldD [Salinivirgaceae bacterium]
MNKIFILLIFFSFITASCKQDYVPKPRGYFRIDLPKKEYKNTPKDLPYSFEYPKYSYLLANRKAETEKYWINMVFPRFNATVHLSYKDINGNLDQYLTDTRNFVYKHTIKADAIIETPYIAANKNVYGMHYEIKGDAASNVQFYLTDSTKNFVRGALYFNVTPNKDSLAPVLKFINIDIAHLMETFKWK